MVSTASRKMSFGARRDLMPVISRKEKTRSGVASQTSGSKSGMDSMSPTVVVPDLSS